MIAWSVRSSLQALSKELESILQGYAKERPIFLFAPGLTWKRQLFQRPQQLALALARQGGLVFYLDPFLPSHHPNISKLNESLYLLHAPDRLAEQIPSPYLYLLPWSYAPVAKLKSPRLIYDILDDLSVFQVDTHVLNHQHDFRLRHADLVLVSATRLYDKVFPQRNDVLLCPNGVDFKHFNEVTQPIPLDIQSLVEGGHPIVGYHGALAEWFDYQLMVDLARLRPEYIFLLIGPDHDGSLQSSGLLDHENVKWLGEKIYSELPAYMQIFDVAIIPFRVNEITNSTSPIKLFEYMAGGKPIVATPIAECKRYSNVLLAETPEAFSQQIDQAMTLRGDQDYIRGIIEIGSENTWDARARIILETIKKLKP